MAINTAKCKSTGDVRLALSGTPEQRIERYKAWATGSNAATFKTATAIGQLGDNGGPKIPELGDTHDDNEDLIAQGVDGHYIDESHTAAEYIVTYSARRFGVTWPSNQTTRIRVRHTSEFARVFVDLDGIDIGSPYFDDIVDHNDDPAHPEDGNDPAWIDPDAEVGTMIRATKTNVDVQILVPQLNNPLWDTLMNVVNNEPMFGAPAGEVQYIGADLDQRQDPISGRLNYYMGVLHFLRGRLRVRFGGETINVPLHQRLDIFWRKRILADGRTIREPSDWRLATVHEQGDLSNLLPPPGPGVA